MTNDKPSPLVTVIVNSYNYERFIGQAISSALNQTYENVEVICVDDGSTDNSIEIIKQFKNVKSLFKPNGGQTSAVRAVLPMVTGDIVIILDSDDLLLPHACATIVEHWHQGVSMVQYRMRKEDLEGNCLGYYPDHPYVRGREREFVLKYGYIPASPMSGNAFSRDHVMRSFTHNNDDCLSVDGYLLFTAPLVGDVVSLDDVLAIYRVHGKNFSLSVTRDLKRAKALLMWAIAHREGIVHVAAERSLSNKKAYDLLDPYSWRTALLIKKAYPQDEDMAKIGAMEMLWRGVWGFFRFPHISAWRRVKNIIGMLVIACGPRSMARRRLPAPQT